MKRYWQIPGIPSAVIAVLATLLGVLVTVRFVPDNPAHRASGGVGVGAILAVLLVVVALVAHKALVDRRFQMQRSLLEAFLDHIPDNIFFKDRASRFLQISRSMANYFGLADPSEAVNKTDADFFSAEHADRALADEQEILRTGEPLVGMEEKETWPDGRENWVHTTKVPLHNQRGHVIGTMGISRDITDRKEAEFRIRYMALHDGLTGLPNRILLEDRLTQCIALAGRNQSRVAVLMLDLDHFKKVNDSVGHHVGDQLLQAVSQRLRESLRESDIVGRLGGDEFVIALPAVCSKSDIECVVSKLLTTLAEPYQIDGHELMTTGSIGIAQYPVDGENAELLLQIADTAMYQAKKNMRGTHLFFTPEFTEATRFRQRLENDLRHALHRGEFVLHYQPLVSTKLGTITGMEALLRWRHPEHGIIPPLQFIPQLEEMGLMVEVGSWVLETACRQNAEWQQQGLPPVRVAVNLSPQQFYRDDIVDTVESVLRATGLDPQWLELELTESLTLDDTEATIQIMSDLKSLGVSLSLDDFGTGWSSLSYLRRFHLDRIKIDRSFLRDIASQPAAEAIVRTIITLGRNLGLTCVAEGVETREQLNYLQKQECAEIQGFFYSPALPAGECETLLRSMQLGIPWSPAALSEGSSQPEPTEEVALIHC
jgi:diguanylate cyclase (GGDEF)-like protein/PAS domain S-box-containing protein